MFDWKNLELVELPVINKPENLIDKISKSLTFYGEVWCLTGSFDNFRPRSKAEDIIKKNGGRIKGSVSNKVTHLLCPKYSIMASAKMIDAQYLGIKLIKEDDFIKRLIRNGIDF